jgi:hypothetical protein
MAPLQRERLSPELDTLLRALRSQPEQEPPRDLLPFEEFTLEPEEEKEEGKRKRKLFGLRWP